LPAVHTGAENHTVNSFAASSEGRTSTVANKRQPQSQQLATNPRRDVPTVLPVVHSTSLRTLLIEDIWQLEMNMPINLFFRLKGGSLGQR